MKKITTLFTLLFALAITAPAQTAANPAEQLAEKIARKMKDSLGLTTTQQTQLYNVNIQLHQQKQQVRNQYAGTPAVMTEKIQDVEKTRDGLYQPILTTEQYNTYKQKKRNLVSNN